MTFAQVQDLYLDVVPTDFILQMSNCDETSPPEGNTAYVDRTTAGFPELLTRVPGIPKKPV